MDSETKDDSQPEMAGRPRRTSSFFSVHDYGVLTKEVQSEAGRKGRFLLTHCHDPYENSDGEFNKNVIKSAGSQTGPRCTLQNTYQIKPAKVFSTKEVTTIIKEELREFQEMVYKPAECSLKTRQVANNIKTRVQQLGYERYKVIVLVNVGDKSNTQGVKVSSRCIWDADTDNFASGSITNSTLFATASVYAMYFE